MAGGRNPYRFGASAGLIAGVGMIYLAAVGLVGTFAERPIIAGIGGEDAGVLTLGRLMLVSVPFVTALVIGARSRGIGGTGPVGPAIAAAALCGATAGAAFAAFVIIISLFDFSSIFIPLTESLVEFLAFGLDPVVGAVIWIAIGAVTALLAGLLQLVDQRDRRAILAAMGIVVLVAMMEPILEPILGQLELDALSDFLFAEGGLTPAAAALIAGLVIAYMWATSNPASPVKRELAGMSDERRRQLQLAGIVLGVIAVLAVPLVATGFVSLVLFNVGLYLMLALGLNIVVGYAGLLDLGYVAFFAVGAYTMGLLTAPSSALGGPMSQPFGPEWAFWLALPIVLLVAAGIGVLIGAPVLRLRGDYLAIVTLGFGEIARVLVESEALGRFSVARTASSASQTSTCRSSASCRVQRSTTTRSSSSPRAPRSSPGGCRGPAPDGPGTPCARTSQSRRRPASTRRITSCSPSRSAGPSEGLRGRCSRCS